MYEKKNRQSEKNPKNHGVIAFKKSKNYCKSTYVESSFVVRYNKTFIAGMFGKEKSYDFSWVIKSSYFSHHHAINVLSHLPLLKMKIT